MNKLFNWFKSLNNTKETSKLKEFTFETLEACKVGDKYIYKIQAKNRQEAFIKLVKYFYGDLPEDEVKSEHLNIHYPNLSTFETNMPTWFAKRISGYVKEGNYNYQKQLEKFAIDNDIKLKQL